MTDYPVVWRHPSDQPHTVVHCSHGVLVMAMFNDGRRETYLCDHPDHMRGTQLCETRPSS